MVSKQERLIVLGRLSSVLAHEIRNPLAGISAATQVLGGKLGGTDPRKKYVGMILKEIERVDEIVKNLLDYARDGRACMMRADVRALVDAALERASDRIGRAGVTVETCGDGGVPYVRCDAQMIGRVLDNLIGNALDAMPDGGTLTLRTTHDAASGRVAVAVEDTGIGTDVDDLGELFSPFYTTKTKGNGLGLPVALKCVEEHGGTIRAARNEPRGLAMTVEWPVEPRHSDEI
jgi:signal transduction histidine kinase